MNFNVHGILPCKTFLNVGQERPIALMDDKSGVLRALVSVHPNHVLADELRQLDAIAALPDYALAEALLQDRIAQKRQCLMDYCIAAVAQLHLALLSESRDVFIGSLGAVQMIVRDAKERFGNVFESKSDQGAMIRMFDRVAVVFNCAMIALAGQTVAPSGEQRKNQMREACFTLWLLGNVAGQRDWCYNQLADAVDVLAKVFLPIERSADEDDHGQVAHFRLQIVQPLCAAVRAVHARALLWEFPLINRHFLLEEAKRHARSACLFVPSCAEQRFELAHCIETKIRFVEIQTNNLFDDETEALEWILAKNGFTYLFLNDSETLLNASSDIAWTMRFFGAYTNGVIEKDIEMQNEAFAILRDCSFASWTRKARFCPQHRFLCKYMLKVFAEKEIEPPCTALRNFSS